MTIKIKKSDVVKAAHRMMFVLSKMENENKDIGLDYFVTSYILTQIINEGSIKFADDDCIYIKTKEDKNASGEKPVATEVPGDISGVNAEDKGSEDGQKEMAPDSLN